MERRLKFDAPEAAVVVDTPTSVSPYTGLVTCNKAPYQPSEMELADDDFLISYERSESTQPLAEGDPVPYARMH